MPLFDSYIFVDWNSSIRKGPQNPAENNVWIGEFPSENILPERYCRSRTECIDYLYNRLIKHIEKERRVLLGFDFPYGYPKGFAYALNYDNGHQLWLRIWKELSDIIQDAQNNVNNRFEVADELNVRIGGPLVGPFWGRPQNYNFANLHTYSPGFPFQTTNGISLERLRLVDQRLPGVQEIWKLYGQGCVGSQALVGIPRLYYLKKHITLSQYSKIWPFETGFTRIPVPKQGPFILHAEIWPGVVNHATADLIANEPYLIRDQAQVRAMCRWAAELDNNNEFGDFFGPPAGLSDRQKKECIEEEGWILGAR